MTRLTFFSNEMIFLASDASSTVEISDDDIGACIDGDDGPSSACTGNDSATADGASDDGLCIGDDDDDGFSLR